MTELNPVEDDFVVLATDGVTNALSPSEIMALLKKYDGSENANGYPLNHAQLLVKSALTRWKQNKLKATILQLFASSSTQHLKQMKNLRV
uniref:PPM-type phosphatase domain-containing protein n=1 Tax=Ditylenchus dipsaci TaxID=166011 RepID=A0A915D1S7_9BILA